MKARIVIADANWLTKPAGVYQRPYVSQEPKEFPAKVVMLDAEDPKVAAFLKKHAPEIQK